MPLNGPLIFYGVLTCCFFLFLLLFLLLAFTPEIPRGKRYEDIKDSLKTGDVIGFCGTFVEHFLVRVYTRCPLSHVGIVYRNDKNELFIFESTNNSCYDVLTGLDSRSGLVLERLEDKLSTYSNYKFFHIPFINLYGKEVDKKKMERKMKKLNCHKFNDDTTSWVWSFVFDIEPDDDKGRICSETVHELLVHIGIAEYDSSFNKLPSHFFNKDIKLRNGWVWGKMQAFTYI